MEIKIANGYDVSVILTHSYTVAELADHLQIPDLKDSKYEETVKCAIDPECFESAILFGVFNSVTRTTYDVMMNSEDEPKPVALILVQFFQDGTVKHVATFLSEGTDPDIFG